MKNLAAFTEPGLAQADQVVNYISANTEDGDTVTITARDRAGTQVDVVMSCHDWLGFAHRAYFAGPIRPR